ncbi:hypothetical protein K151_112 [Proteus hauseri ZMd44]|nr:hypothetical protein K151_112 [Proteus hauseri ZMd44]
MDSRKKVIVFIGFHKNVMMDKIIMAVEIRGVKASISI